jgi:hypothetical protein
MIAKDIAKRPRMITATINFFMFLSLSVKLRFSQMISEGSEAAEISISSPKNRANL